MNALGTKTVANLVTDNIKTAHVFKKFGIDFCCGGGISVYTAALKANVDYELLEKELLNVASSITPATNFNDWNLDFLTDYIVNVHHGYVSQNIPLLLQYAEKVINVHGLHYKELEEIHQLLLLVTGELSAHLKKEELIVFPFIKKLVKAKSEKIAVETPHFGSLNNPITMMKTEHEEAGETFMKIAQLTQNYTPPANACNTFKAFYEKLDEFEQDLHQHVHLENNILFPKAIRLEEQLRTI